MRRWAWLGLALLLAGGCSKKQSAPVTCDNGGFDLIAFASDRRQNPGHYQIWLYDLDGQGFRVLRNLASPAAVDSEPALSSDVQLIAFTRSDTADRAHTRIQIYDRASCGFVSRPALATGYERNPAFTGNAARLTFARDTLGHWRIRMMNADGSMSPIGHLGDAQAYDDWDPAPDLDGGLIAFVSNRVTAQFPDGSAHVYVYDVAHDSLVATPGLDSLAYTQASGDDLDPAITPDGRLLCMASNRTGGKGGFDLYLYDLTARTLQRLDNANSDRDERHPSLRFGGAGVVFESWRDGGGGQRDLWIYTIGTAAPVQAGGMTSTGDDLHPSAVWP